MLLSNTYVHYNSLQERIKWYECLGVAKIHTGLQIRGCLEFFRDVAVQFADHLVNGFFPRGVRILGVGDGVVKLVQGDFCNLQESVWNLSMVGGGKLFYWVKSISWTFFKWWESRPHSNLSATISLSKKTYEMKTCSALLQTLNLMKGSCSLCSLHRYNESKAAIINFHLKASLISQSCFQEPKLTTDELSSRGFCTLPPGTWAEE